MIKIFTFLRYFWIFSEEFEVIEYEDSLEKLQKEGPKLKINKVEAAWEIGKKPIEIRLLLTENAGSLATEYLTLANTGTTAIFYAWKVC